MSSLVFRSATLPWSDTHQERLFKQVLISLLLIMLVLGFVVPNIALPELKRESLEKLPPQLAKVIKRKKEIPKLQPLPKVEKKLMNPVEKKVEVVKKEVVKPVPKVVAVPPPMKPKPQLVKNKERSPERIKAAKAKAKKLISNFSNDLADMKSMVDMQSLNVGSSILTNAGAAETVVGSVINQTAVNRINGVDESQLTRATGAENLQVAKRDTTSIKSVNKEELVDKVVETKVAGLNRSQMQIRRVFEQNKSRFDRIYRKALRSNPVLQGTVTLGVEIAVTGEVSDCHVKSSDFQDDKVIKRIALTCKMLAFDAASKVDKFDYPLTFSP